METYFMQTVPNSHSFGSLKNILAARDYDREDELSPDYILIWIKNSIKRNYELAKVEEVDGGQGPCFTNIDSIIEFLEGNDWSLTELYFRIENTLKNGYDLKPIYKMERQEVYQHIDIEREYQDLKWDGRRSVNDVPDRDKPVAEWINYMEFHLNKAKEQNYFLNRDGALEEIRKVIALGVRALEIHGCPERIIPVELTENE